MAENIELLYPIYLDIPMMISFVATIDGGYALERVWKETYDKSGEASGSLEGDTGLSDFISKFVKTNLKASGALDGKLSNSQENQVTFKRTEASVFMGLRHALLQQKRIKRLDDYSTKEWSTIPLSSIVEISGEIHRSPVNEIVQISKRIIPIMLQSIPIDKDGKVDTEKLSPSDLASWQNISIMQGIVTDLESSPLSDVILKHKKNGEKTAVLDLSTATLSFMQQEILHCGHVTVIGKVTRVLAEKGDNINLYRRSVLGITAKSISEQFTKSFSSSPDINIGLEPSTVEPLAVEIVPMAIYI